MTIWYPHAFDKCSLTLQLNVCGELTEMSSEIISRIVSLLEGRKMVLMIRAPSFGLVNWCHNQLTNQTGALMFKAPEGPLMSGKMPMTARSAHETSFLLGRSHSISGKGLCLSFLRKLLLNIPFQLGNLETSH